MKKRILVANRGEIAIRLIRAIQELDYDAIAVYETPDEMSRHIRIADEAILLGDGPRCDYLNIEKIIRAAKKSGACAIHPGYGFLAENPFFAKACENDEASRRVCALGAFLDVLDSEELRKIIGKENNC